GLLSAWFPELDAQELREFKEAQSPEGAIPRSLGNLNQQIGSSKDTAPKAEGPDVGCMYAFQIYTRYRWTGDQRFIEEFYPSAKHVLEYVATLDMDGDGIPDGPSAYT